MLKSFIILPYFRIPFRNISWASAGLIKLFLKRMYLLPIISKREGKAHYNNGPPLGSICCQSQTVETRRGEGDTGERERGLNYMKRGVIIQQFTLCPTIESSMHG